MQQPSKTMLGISSYVIVTPARNEAQFIELTLKCVVEQTILPLRWVIVSDGSTDGTDEIVRKYASVHPWIELVRMPERRSVILPERFMPSTLAMQECRDLDYDVVVSLDGDISFDAGLLFILARKIIDRFGPRPGRDAVPAKFLVKHTTIALSALNTSRERARCFAANVSKRSADTIPLRVARSIILPLSALG